MTFSIPQPASTVIVLRDRVGEGVLPGIEVFMVKRHAASAFLGGAHVFPGGRVDAEDHGDQNLCDGIPEAVLRLPGLEPRQAIGYHIAAARELFEEAGLLLARGASGKFLSMKTEGVKPKFEAYREAIHAGTVSLSSLLREERLRLALDSLHLYAHWVTPKIEGHRFDTLFFVARCPKKQVPFHDESETVKSAWFSPRQALDVYEQGEIDLAPPTIATLEELTPFSSVDDVIAFAKTKPIVRIEARVVESEGEKMLVLPGDPLYPVPPGEEVTGHTRFVREGDRWHTRSL